MLSQLASKQRKINRFVKIKKNKDIPSIPKGIFKLTYGIQVTQVTN